MAYTPPSEGQPVAQAAVGDGIAEIGAELAALSRAIAVEQLEAEKKMAPAKAEKAVSAKGA